MDGFALDISLFAPQRVALCALRTVLSGSCESRENALNDGPEPLSDLVSRIISGDRAAEEELIQNFARGVRNLLRFNSRTPDVADDMFQDTFITVLGKLRRGEIRDPDKLKSFIHSVARNLTTKHYSKDGVRRTRADVTMLQTIASELPGPLEVTDSEQTVELLTSAIEDLSVGRDRVLLKRYFFEGTHIDRVCEEIGTDRKHFYRRKHRAIRRLVELVKERLS